MNFRKYQCQCCDLYYDEAEGWPDEGIPAGTPWDEVPEEWTCPDCSASKEDFALVI